MRPRADRIWIEVDDAMKMINYYKKTSKIGDINALVKSLKKAYSLSLLEQKERVSK